MSCTLNSSASHHLLLLCPSVSSCRCPPSQVGRRGDLEEWGALWGKAAGATLESWGWEGNWEVRTCEYRHLSTCWMSEYLVWTLEQWLISLPFFLALQLQGSHSLSRIVSHGGHSLGDNCARFQNWCFFVFPLWSSRLKNESLECALCHRSERKWSIYWICVLLGALYVAYSLLFTNWWCDYYFSHFIDRETEDHRLNSLPEAVQSLNDIRCLISLESRGPQPPGCGPVRRRAAQQEVRGG